MFGSVETLSGRHLQPADVVSADVLLVRSVTRVNAGLLADCRVRFVGSATSGVDHVDTGYLSRSDIAFAAASGSNATSVAEYVLSALLAVLHKRGERLAGKSVGIVGCGQVGSRVSRLLTSLGCQCLHNDPQKQRLLGNGGFVSLGDILQADIVTVHVPLTLAGEDTTAGLFDTERLAQLRPDVILINTARGGVIDEAALLAQATKSPRMTLIIDCWDGEPGISVPLLQRAAIATPHIAGYSVTGKTRATWQLHQALAAFLDQQPTWEPPPASGPRIVIRDERGVAAGDELLRFSVSSCYDAAMDTGKLRKTIDMDPAGRIRMFDELRKHYPARYEFADCVIDADCLSTEESALQQLAGLGFSVARAKVD